MQTSETQAMSDLSASCSAMALSTSPVICARTAPNRAGLVSAIARSTSSRIWKPDRSPVPEDLVQVTMASSERSALS